MSHGPVVTVVRTIGDVAARLARGHAQPARLPGTRRDRPHRRRGRRRRRRDQAAQGRRAHRLARRDQAERQAGRAGRRPAVTGLVTWYSDGRSTFTASGRLGVAAAGRRDLHGRGAGGRRGEDDDRRRLHLRVVAGGGRPHRRLRPARLGPRAGWLRAQGRSPTFDEGYRPEDWVDDGAAGGAAAGRPGRARRSPALRAGAQLVHRRADRPEVHGPPEGEPAERAARRDPRQAVLRGGDAAVRGVQGRDGRHVVSGLGAVAARRREAPGGVRHRRPHPPGAHLVRGRAEAPRRGKRPE